MSIQDGIWVHFSSLWVLPNKERDRMTVTNLLFNKSEEKWYYYDYDVIPVPAESYSGMYMHTYTYIDTYVVCWS
jgi:hypothetical protein